MLHSEIVGGAGSHRNAYFYLMLGCDYTVFKDETVNEKTWFCYICMCTLDGSKHTQLSLHLMSQKREKMETV